jgi:hypothetical protein
MHVGQLMCVSQIEASDPFYKLRHKIGNFPWEKASLPTYPPTNQMADPEGNRGCQ